MLTSCEHESGFSTDIRCPIVPSSEGGKQEEIKEGRREERGWGAEEEKGGSEGKKMRRAELKKSKERREGERGLLELRVKKVPRAHWGPWIILSFRQTYYPHEFNLSN